MRWVRQGPSHDNASPALAAYRASQLPPGFHLTVAGAQILGGASVPASHLVYSDGLATVSVFVEAQQVEVQGAGVASDAALSSPSEPPMQGLARVGSGSAFSTVVQGHQVTAVGEVPAETVEYHRALGHDPSAPPKSRTPDSMRTFVAVLTPWVRPVRGDAAELAALPAAAQAGCRRARRGCRSRRQSAPRTQDSGAALAGELVCHGRLDPEEVHKALAYHRRPV